MLILASLVVETPVAATVALVLAFLVLALIATQNELLKWRRGCKEAEETIAGLCERCRDKDEVIKIRGNWINRLRKDLGEADRNYQARFEECRKQVMEHETEAARAKRDEGNARTAIFNVTARLKETEAMLADRDRQIGNLTGEVRAIEKSEAVREEEVKEYAAKLREAEAMLATRDQEIAELCERCRDKQAVLDGHWKDIVRLREQITVKDKLIGTLEWDLCGERKKLADRDRQIGNLTGEVRAIEKSEAVREEEVKEYAAKLREAEAKLTESQNACRENSRWADRHRCRAELAEGRLERLINLAREIEAEDVAGPASNEEG